MAAIVIVPLIAPLIAALAFAAQPTAAAQQGSLVADPQQGATPRPLSREPVARTVVEPVPASPAPPLSTVSVPRAPPARPRGVPGGLPAPGDDPLRIDPATDPILQLARTQSPLATFQQAIRAAVARNPARDEAIAEAEEARGVRGEARARVLPVAELSMSSFRIIDRAFSNDPNNILERSRPRYRTDALVRVQQPIVDFGSSLGRIRASEARLEAARAGIEDVSTQIALRAVSVWYAVYGYRVLERLGEAFADSQRAVRVSIEERVRRGVAAPGDLAQVDSYIASSDSQLAEFRRQRASAEAQYAAVIGSAPPAGLARAPVPALAGIAAGTLASDIDRLPAVRAARFGADAARSDSRALKADRLPQLSAGVDAGRYGLLESARDYDIRGSLTLSMRLGGGAAQRVAQAVARVNGADARLRRVRIETRRDAEIALSDIATLQEAQDAIGRNYLASRRARDVLAERFRVARGTLFDVLGAESNYFGVAAQFVQTMIELDSARYTLLARTGRLLPPLGIQPDTLEPR